MNTLDTIARRESIRSYDPGRPVDAGALGRILEAARLAPSAANRQPWEFIVVQSPEGLARVRPCYGRPWFQDAPAILAVTGFRDQAWVRERDGFNALETDLAIAMTHVLLAAQHEGVATCWISNFDPGALRQALGLSRHQEVFSITPLGYPRAGFQGAGPKQRRPLEELVRWM